MPRAERLHGLRVLRAPVLDVLGLVEDDRVKLMLPEGVQVAPDQRVRRDDKVRRRNPRQQGAPTRPVQHDDLQPGRESTRLGRPVEDEGRGAHDQARATSGGRARRPDGGQVRQDLQRLAKAHLVGQHAAEPLVAEEAKPRDALALVRAQDVLECAEVGAFQPHLAGGGTGLGPPCVRGLQRKPRVLHARRQEAGLGVVQPVTGALGRPVPLLRGRVHEDLLEFLHRARVDEGQLAVAKPSGPAPQELLDLRGRDDGPGLRRVGDVEVEPLLAAGRDGEAGRDALERGLRGAI